MIDMQQQQQQKKHLGKEKSTYKEFLMYSFDCDKFWITIMFLLLPQFTRLNDAH